MASSNTDTICHSASSTTNGSSCSHTPVITSSAAFKFECAERMGDVLNSVTEAVCEVIGWVDAPGITGHGVWHVLDAA